MLQDRSIVQIADNSGGITGRVFKILGGTRKRTAEIGDELVLSIQTAQPRKSVKKKDIHRAVVVRQTKAFRRKDGSYIRFDENAVVLVEKDKKEPKANRVFGPIPREVIERGYQKVASLAPEIL
ncbi:50S ribosomal protein L14 [Candidatus Kaiserbacteria bacterium RIFCSPHIGHO2_01_FULL_50_13]|uniref:Large ribosomal subunit protein uL14 n=1 Tax=Candidatus Kaiserbacteria bacterium RIFCSPLOWO2_01_FULL_50_24 TaxID=1798507 RepID=A0A1F6EJD5_9BACT|nr:MAG: 50S ribosomal protein L14 [Candidatus Kaiserbacteria bacterium RIFCSPHIGHO2_01_FULL_50_13]OGG73422.1 MAG: 50S ribosomal protein L14 [Candidatus Kaiserbacteria bacterium RIFCSPLOWO2_01_FULL_50_24]OGG81305.1 MAG: 50S ribosomal protein L14 [Candidatus Kaiserbacteria bacterium RIFCSPLOWO2_02_FULL_51_13]